MSSVVTPCHSPRGASLSQFLLFTQFSPPVALKKAINASLSVSGDVSIGGGVSVAVGETVVVSVGVIAIVGKAVSVGEAVSVVGSFVESDADGSFLESQAVRKVRSNKPTSKSREAVRQMFIEKLYTHPFPPLVGPTAP